jgi:hypothetical protein
MKLRMTVATVALLVLGVMGAGVVSAQPPTTHPTGNSTSHANQVVGYRAHCTPATPGGMIKVQAKVLHAVRGTTPFTAVAVATFTSSNPSVTLRRAGKSFLAVGKIPVPANQATGPVLVTVRITYGGTSTDVTCTSQILAASPAPVAPTNPGAPANPGDAHHD